MKKLITSALLSVILFSAQANSENDNFRIQAADITRRMANQLELNESEYIQLKGYTLEKLVAAAEVKEMYSIDINMMLRKLNEIDDIYKHRVQNILTNKQFENYLTLNKSFKSELTTIATIP